MYRKLFARNCTKQFGKCLMVTRTLHHDVKPRRKSVREISIPVPWGKISGKLWGSENEQPILALHGWQDNAGSFDALAPLLLDNCSVLAIDMPGYGFSNWIPPGFAYSELLYTVTIFRLKEYFGWDQVKLLSHSLGTWFSFSYASVYPKDTKFVIVIDGWRYPPIKVPEHTKLVASTLHELMKLESMNSIPPSYSEQKIIEKRIEGSKNSLDETACRTLMVRGVTKNADGTYYFHRDPRLNYIITYLGFTYDHLQQLTGLIECPYLIIKADNSDHIKEDEDTLTGFEVLKKSSRDFKYLTIPGKHHVHMTNPEVVAKVINPFIKKYNK